MDLTLLRQKMDEAGYIHDDTARLPMQAVLLPLLWR